MTALNRKLHLFAGLALLLQVVATPAFAHVGGFLKLEGVEGDATDAEHPGWVALSSFSWEDVREVDGRGGIDYGVAIPTSGSGVLIVTKPVADELLGMKALCKNKDAKFSEIEFSHPRESLPRAYQPRGRDHTRDVYPPFINFKLKGVTMPKCVRAPGAEGEAFWLRFEEIEWLNLKQPATPPGLPR